MTKNNTHKVEVHFSCLLTWMRSKSCFLVVRFFFMLLSPFIACGETLGLCHSVLDPCPLLFTKDNSQESSHVSVVGKSNTEKNPLPELVWVTFSYFVAWVSAIINLVWPEKFKPPPAFSWHCLYCYPLLPVWVFRPPKEPQGSLRLCLFLQASLQSQRDLQTAELRRGWRREGRRGWCEDAGGGDRQLIPGLDTRAAVWRAGAHFKTPRLSAPC